MAEVTATPVSAVLRIPVDLVDPGPNVRASVGDVTELATSMRAIGQQIPVVVVASDGGRWRLIDGHRRHAAARQAGLPYLDAIVRRSSDDARRVVAQLAIQGNVRLLDPMAEARALHSLMWDHGLTREQIAAYVGRSPAWVRDRISLVYLSGDEAAAVESGQMTVAEALLRLRTRRAGRAGEPDAPATRSGRRSGRRSTTDRRPAARQAGDRQLTALELALLTCLAEGLELREAAERVGIGYGEARYRQGLLYEALGARNGPHAVHLAHLAGLLGGQGRPDPGAGESARRLSQGVLPLGGAT